MVKKGNIPWNKGKTGVQINSNKGKKVTYSKDAQKKMKLTQFKKGQVPWNKGIGKICKDIDCNKKSIAKEYCSSHYYRWKTYGDPQKSANPKETGRKLSEANSGTKNSFFGKHHTKKSIEKIRKKKMGTKRTVESIQKQIETHTGFKHSTKSIEKMRKSQSTTKAINRKKDNRAKQKFPTKDTELEKAGQKILRENNIEFTDHKAILGQPDIFIEPNFCIFLDGDHFHGNPDVYPDDHVIFKEYNGRSGYAPELTAKIKREKDHKINLKLKAQGYLVMRTYATPFYENPKKWLNEVREFIKNA